MPKTCSIKIWRDIPTTYIFSMGNKPATLAATKYLFGTAKASGPHKIDNVITTDYSHSPFISRPEWTAETLIKEANH
ncbi:hypothetical protein VP1G_11097 [Cytospora mali]|uniref:Uncharacterized protein n=1 Tax=Cytospora mali TaxID=578113 RepID=A0A194V862_CYTMA|nr:hypothetical protein VP1G_11097 [Valsa mali var. pyri (nom. inval.)]